MQPSDSPNSFPTDEITQTSDIAALPDVATIQDADSASPSSPAQDPVTGLNPSDYTNTSNDNQIAVLSTIDYSTNIHIYNYTINNNTSTTNNSLNRIDDVAAPTSGRATSSANSSSNTAGRGEATSPDDTAGATSLQRSGIHVSFTSRQYFNRRGAWRVDRIYGFNPGNGDMLKLSRTSFKGLRDMNFVIAESGSRRQELSRSDANIIYQESSGKMFFNANGEDRGFGRQGGLFAIFEDAPMIGSDQLMLI